MSEEEAIGEVSTLETASNPGLKKRRKSSSDDTETGVVQKPMKARKSRVESVELAP
jgi:hypothetical protein